ncbi:MFS transporter [Chitinophaga qingshengii]|uniref:MFS transporter n=1 Tax=Chitinophaga qingshengii TaxID=1569794 RepID=A0ABR7TN96_9BACT|nr:MFS transporter [Chitinophaga qingshengii]MBC9931105.1 MFS transporter [Chitinophaga qingshengii]
MKKIAYVGCLGMIGVITTEFGVIGILPQIARYYRVSIEDAGLLLSAFAGVIAFAGPFMMLLLSRVDRKNIMALSLALFLASGLISLLSPPFWLLLVARMLPAFLQPVYISTAIAAATAAAGKQDRHKMMAVVLGGIGIATVTTVPFATYVAGVLDSWQSSFIVQSIISLIALVMILLLLPALPVMTKKSPAKHLTILRKPAFIRSAAMVFFMNAAMFTTYAYFADYLGKMNGMNAATISGMLLLFGIMGVLGNFAAGRALGRSLTGTTIIFLAGLTLIAIPIAYSGISFWATVLLIAVWGFLHTPCFLTGQAYMIAFAPEAPEFANSLSISIGNLGISIGTLAGGWVIGRYGIDRIPWAMGLFGVAALSLILLQHYLEKTVQKKAAIS